MSRLRLPTLLLAFALVGCDSNIAMTGQPAAPAITAEAGVPAILSVGAAGQQVTIDNPGLLPEAVRNAGTLEVAIGGTKVPVAKSPAGFYTFSIPANVKTNLDVAGNLRVVFVMDDRTSRIVTLKTGSPVAFGQPAVITNPNPAFITRGLEVKLKANTEASTDAYQFTWSAGPSAQGPWSPISGTGKEVAWTPPAAGNYFIKVDTVDKATRQSYSTVTSQALIFVNDPEGVVTTEPSSGSVERGASVKLNFNRPAGLTGENLSYNWSAGPSAQGPWSPIQGEGTSVDYLPTSVGQSFVKVDVTNKATGEVNSFVSPKSVVLVTESRPIITPSATSVDRGAKVDLTLNIANPGAGPFTWYYATAPGQWVPIPGNGPTNSLIVNPAGAYNFRVDISQATGGVKTFATTDAVLNVVEREPLIQTDPINLTVKPGDSIPLVLKAQGVDESKFRFVWFVTTNPALGWQTLPFKNVDDQYKKRFLWETSTTTGPVTTVAQPGAYYVRVDAIERNGTATYTFTSSGPVANIQR
ncbi:PKD domain protein [compost metagenome]